MTGFTKKILVLFCSTAFMFILSVAMLPAADEQEMPDEILFDQDIYKTNRKGPVAFTHLAHAEDYELTCEDCHHEYKDGKNVWEEGDPVKKCHACHDPNENKDDVKKLSIAFHKNCKGCHKRLKEEWGSTDAPYKSCHGCHERE